MDSGLYVVLSGCLTYGVPLAIAVRELIILRRDRGNWRPDESPARVPNPRPSGGSKTLPACLTVLPKVDAVPQRVRALEPV